MKGTEHFKAVIKNYLDKRAKEDPMFTVTYANPLKNIDDCITYILNTVRSSGKNGFTDDEVYSMAVHYYDEDDIKVGKAINCNVVVNHSVDRLKQDKNETKQSKVQMFQDTRKMENQRRKNKKEKNNNQQLNLFDLL